MSGLRIAAALRGQLYHSFIFKVTYGLKIPCFELYLQVDFCVIIPTWKEEYTHKWKCVCVCNAQCGHALVTTVGVLNSVSYVYGVYFSSCCWEFSGILFFLSFSYLEEWYWTFGLSRPFYFSQLLAMLIIFFKGNCRRMKYLNYYINFSKRCSVRPVNVTFDLEISERTECT